MQNFVSYEEQFEYSPEESGPFKCVLLRNTRITI